MPEKKSSYTGQTEARRKASAKYLKETVEDIRIRVPKGRKEALQAHAAQREESLNGFVNRAIDEAVERDRDKDIQFAMAVDAIGDVSQLAKQIILRSESGFTPEEIAQYASRPSSDIAHVVKQIEATAKNRHNVN